MRFNDALVMQAFHMLAHNGALAISDFAQMTGLAADEAEELFVALSAALSDENISTELGYMSASGARFAWNPHPGGHGAGPKTRFSAGEDAALRAALADFGMDAGDPLWDKLFEAKGVLFDAAGADGTAKAQNGQDVSGDAPGTTEQDIASGRRGHIVSALSVLASTIDLEEHRLVSFAYCPAGAAQSSMRRVAPVRIVSDGDVSILQAWKCTDDGTFADAADAGDLQGADAAADSPSGGTGFGFRNYRIDRMADVRVLDERFDSAALPEEGGEGKPRMVRLRFAKELPLPEWPGMKLVKRRGGAKGSSGSSASGTPDAPDDAATIEARIPWYGSDWLPQHIAALGGACIPLDDELRERTRSYIARVRAQSADLQACAMR